MITESVEAGHQLEIDFFGWSPRHTEEERLAILKPRLNFYDSYVEVLQSQRQLRWDAKEPCTETARNVFKAVRAAMPKGSRKKLFLYCALGTILDYRYGVDGFFMHGGNFLFCVTFDLTLTGGPMKRKKRKANLLVTKSDLEDQARIEKLGLLVSGLLLTAQQNRIMVPTPTICN